MVFSAGDIPMGAGGKRGRNPTPSAIKKLTGNPGKRRIDPDELKFAEGIPECPEWLGEIGRAKWREMVAILSGVKGWITSADGGLLALYCEAFEEMLSAREEIARDGSTCCSDNGGMYQHPAVGRKNKAIERMRMIGAKFGLSTAGRVGLKMPGAQVEEDPLVTLLKARVGQN